MLIQNLCDWQSIIMYSANHSEIHSIVVNPVFLLNSEQNHMQK